MSSQEESCYLELWKYAFVGLQTMIKEIGADMDQAGSLSLEAYDLLLQLEMSPGMALRMSDLAERALLSPSGITRAIDRLEKLGYVQREADATDGRATLAVLTPAGKAARKESWCSYRQAILSRFKERFTPEEAKAATEILRKLRPGWLD
ncbi:MAG: MarR family transcriptional regulator [Chthonomonas sp.]|nr:MarR family transcriptional regulator [Chthonomonas sp.]